MTFDVLFCTIQAPGSSGKAESPQLTPFPKGIVAGLERSFSSGLKTKKVQFPRVSSLMSSFD